MLQEQIYARTSFYTHHTHTDRETERQRDRERERERERERVALIHLRCLWNCSLTKVLSSCQLLRSWSGSAEIQTLVKDWNWSVFLHPYKERDDSRKWKVGLSHNMHLLVFTSQSKTWKSQIQTLNAKFNNYAAKFSNYAANLTVNTFAFCYFLCLFLQWKPTPNLAGETLSAFRSVLWVV